MAASDHIKEANDAVCKLCYYPHLIITTERKVLKEMLLQTGGKVLAQGRFFDLKSKYLGVGLYRVWMEIDA